MSTPWTLPTLVEQYTEDEGHIAWFEVNNFSNLTTLNNKGTSTVSPLLHISRQPRNDIKMKTYFIRATGFNFNNLPNTISEINLRLTMNRHGRIADETIQLCSNTQLIGENKAGINLNPIQIYGNDTWSIDNIDGSLIQDSSFGVVLRFQSHPRWPHSVTPIIFGIELQIV
jgi:hypothetical protein